MQQYLTRGRPAILEPVKDGAISAQHGPNDPHANMDHGLYHRCQLQQDHQPRHSGWHQLRPRCHHSPGGSTGSSDQHSHGGSIAPGHQHDPRWLARPLASTEFSVATGATDTTPDPRLCRATHLDMVLGSDLCSPWLWVVAWTTQINIVLGAAWSSLTNMAQSGQLDPSHPHGPQ